MTRVRRGLIPIGLLAAFVGLVYVIVANPPGVRRQERAPAPRIAVEVMPVEPIAYRVVLRSFGTVQPRTSGQLMSQVSGMIQKISPEFRDGGFFEAGELLVQIDARDFEAEVKVAQAALTSARQGLAEEQARVAQAMEDWERLGDGQPAPPLVLRKPQLQAAEASVASAEASLSRAQLNLERTRIRAPYAGRVLEAHVDIGEVVTPSTVLADIYAVDYVEIRLPLKNRDLRFIDLPESYRFGESREASQPGVTLFSSLAGSDAWQGTVVRTESAIDDVSQQLHVIAQVDDPYGARARGRQPLKIGEYVTAEIEGRLLADALVIPNRSIYQGGYVYVAQDEVLQRRDVVIAWQNEQEALVDSGLKPGDKLVLTPLGQVVSGTRVDIARHGEQGSGDRREAEQLDSPRGTETAP